MLNIIVLAAGKSSRINSEKPKLLHNLLDQPIIKYISKTIDSLNANNVVFVISKEGGEIKQSLGNKNYVFDVQDQQKGTADAVFSAKSLQNKKGETLIIMGDSPLIKPETLKMLIDKNKNFDLTVLTTFVDDGQGYGRIVRGKGGEISKIIEHRDATPEQKAIKEINTGVYCIKNEVLFKFLPYLQNSKNNSNELYFVDIVKLLQSNNRKVQAAVVNDSTQFMGVNTRADLQQAEAALTRRINKKHLKNGVSLINPSNTYIGEDVEIERDCVVYNNVHIYGKTKIASGVVIKSGTWIENATIGKSCEIDNSIIKNSVLKNNVFVGPFANIKQNSLLGESVVIGAFVEVKNSIIGEFTKSKHHAYIGDADIGQNVNIGCGVVFANYNGYSKNHTIVRDDAFIGSNANLIAPITIGEGAYVAAGSTINLSVEDGAMAIARSFQTNKLGYAKKYLKSSKNKETTNTENSGSEKV